MKSECHQKKVLVVSESRKIRKPLMEKKRRARINDSLETLKQMLLDSKTILKESSGKQGQRTAKLEKADILEMTVNYLQYLHRRLNETPKERIITSPSKSKPEIAIRPADSSCEPVQMGVALIPTKLNTGEIVFVVPSMERNKKYSLSNCSKIGENMWRPW